MTFGFLGSRLAERRNERAILVIGLAMALAGSLGLLTTALLHLTLIAVIWSLFTMVGGVAAASPSATSLALRGDPDIAGTASSLLGLARFAFGGVAAPLVGIAGANNALPFGVVTVAAVAPVAAAAAYLGLVRTR